MTEASDLSALYEAVFGAMPSAASRATLHRLQKFLGLKRGDAFSRMLIVQLRSADQMEETRLQLQRTLDALAPLLTTVSTLARQLEASSATIERRNRRIPAMIDPDDLVPSDEPASPLLNYLACAFRPARHHDDLYVSERCSKAAFDLLFLMGAAVALILIGLCIGKFAFR